MLEFFKTHKFAILVFFVVLIAHSMSRNITSFDSRWVIFTSMSIISEGNTDLDEYQEVLEANGYYGVEQVNGHYYSIFPIGTSVLAVPFVFVIKALGFPVLQSFTEVEVFIASFLVALASVFVYLTAWRKAGSGIAGLVALVFAFCTSMWSTASRGLWQHGPSVLMLALALYLLLAGKKNPKLVPLAALPLACAFIIRPTNIVSIIVLSFYVLRFHRRAVFKYLLLALLVAAPFVYFNYQTYGGVLPPYYAPGRVGETAFIGEALMGNLISPGRGLYIFSPVLLFSIAGMGLMLKSKERGEKALAICALLIIIFHWLVVSSFPHWWGGHCFGPRYMTDILPHLAFFLVPVFQWTFKRDELRKAIVLSVFSLLAGFSFFVHYRGANDWAIFEWNAVPCNIDICPERLWDWEDLQFMRGIEDKLGFEFKI
ncbi:hypothetical protein KKB83_02880 [Patescibacteria group bacterium]|nr:hypothetical protein [Patescibacteria group bacterium]